MRNLFQTPKRGKDAESPLSEAGLVGQKRGHLPSDEAATKLIFLALRNITKVWKMPQRTRKEAANQFAIVFDDRFMASEL